MHVRTSLVMAMLALPTMSAQAALQLALEIRPTLVAPDEVAIIAEHGGPLPQPFDMSFTIEAEPMITGDNGIGTSWYAMYRMHADSPGYIQGRLSSLSSIRIRPDQVAEGTAEFRQTLLSGVAPSATALKLRSADTFQWPDSDATFSYERILNLHAYGDVGAPLEPELPVDEQAMARWLASQLGHVFAGAYNETYSQAIGSTGLQTKTVIGDVVLKSVVIVPEPSTLHLSFLGLAGLAAWARGRHREARNSGREHCCDAS